MITGSVAILKSRHKDGGGGNTEAPGTSLKVNFDQSAGKFVTGM
jgi:hypothetical protein